MLRRILPLAAVLLVPVFAGAAQPAEKPPAVVVRVASLDNLFDHLKLLGGSDDYGKKLDDAIKSKLGPKGLFGIDAKRPIGLYARFGMDLSDINGVLMVPVTGDKEFRDMLEALGWEVKGDKAPFTVKQNLWPMDVQYRIANGYAYVGLLGNDSVAPDSLLPPAKVFTDKQTSAVALTVRLDLVPADGRDLILEMIKDRLDKGVGDKGTTKGQKAFRDALAKEAMRLIEGALKEGEEANAQFDIDPKTKQMVVELTLSARAKTRFAETIARLGQRQTLFAGVLDKDAAMNALVNVELPGESQGAMQALVQEAFNGVLAGLQDDGAKKQARMLLDAVKPSLTAGMIDAAISFRGPSRARTFTLVAGLRLNEGDKVAAALRERIKDLPPKERDVFNLDVDKAGGVGIHRLDVQSCYDDATKKLFGPHPLYLAIRDDALFLATGEDGLAALKQAVTAQGAAAPALQFDLSMARFAVMNARDAKVAETLISARDDARMRITVEGGPVLRVRMTMALSAMSLFTTAK